MPSKDRKDSPIVISWVGGTDIQIMNAWRSRQGLPLPEGLEKTSRNASGEECTGHNGPIRTLTDSCAASSIFLLVSKKFEPAAEMIRDWVLRGSNAECVLVRTGLTNPTCYEEVFKVTDAFFKKHWDQQEADRYWFNLTPGTPATQAIMLYLSQVRYAGGKAFRVVEFQYRDKQGKQAFEVRLPFRIPAETLGRGSGSPWEANEQLKNVKRIFAPVRSVNILLMGETGVGKSYCAREIHEISCAGDRSRNFVALNCAELAAGDGNMFRAALFGAVKGAYSGAVRETEGAFSKAKGGTLFLDEIGEIPLDRQAILLQALQERKIFKVGNEGGEPEDIGDVRIIAATNRNLVEEVRQNRFRSDLFYRIGTCPVTLPPLRKIILSDKKGFRHYVMELMASIYEENTELRGLSAENPISPEAWNELQSYSWPGNFRELRHILLLACVMAHARGADCLDACDLIQPLAVVRPLEKVLRSDEPFCPDDEDYIPASLDMWMNDHKRKFIERALQRSGGNMAEAAKILGMAYQKLVYFLSNQRNKSESD